MLKLKISTAASASAAATATYAATAAAAAAATDRTTTAAAAAYSIQLLLPKLVLLLPASAVNHNNSLNIEAAPSSKVLERKDKNTLARPHTKLQMKHFSNLI